MDLPWEDYLLERKVESDLKDLLKTLVAFANSVRPGHIAKILIGEKDDGTVQGVANPDRIQQRVRAEAESIYPDIIFRSEVYERDQKFCVRVEIEYSGDTPHFGGPAWIRRGSSTIKASEEVFQKLIETRLEKIRELAKWVNQTITIDADLASVPPPRTTKTMMGKDIFGYNFFHPWTDEKLANLIFINSFWLTLEKQNGQKVSVPLEKIMLSYDNENNRLTVIIAF